MFSTISMRIFCAMVVLVSIVGLATATFEGSSNCDIHIHRASGKVLWCEAQGAFMSQQNVSIYIAPMNDTTNRVAIYNFESNGMMIGSTTTATPYLETESGRVMITISMSTFAMVGSPVPVPTTTFNGFFILSGFIQDPTSFATVYTNATATEVLAITTQGWSNGIFLFSTSLTDTNNISYKAFVPNNNNGLSLVDIFPYSTISQTNVHAWAMDGSSRLCLSVTADESYIVCRAVSNSSTDLVIHTDANTITFLTLVSDNNGRIFWSEANDTNSWRVWAANSDKTDTPVVLDRTTNETYVSANVMYGNNLAFGYDSYNKLVYWTELIPLPTSEYTFGVYGWDGKSSAVVTYFGAGNTSATITQICTSNGQMILTTSELTMMIGMPFPMAATQRLYHTSPSTNGTPASSLLLSHSFQMTIAFVLACDEESGWAVLGFSDTMNQIGSAVSAINIDNTTTLSLQYSTDVNITLGTSITVTDGIVGYSLGNVALGFYDLFFYTLVPDELVAVPLSSDDSPSSPNTTPMPAPSTNTTPVKGPSGKVSFAYQIAPLIYIASLAYLFL